MVEWSTILQAVTVATIDDRGAGLDQLMRCWESTGPHEHPQRCVLAHYVADLQAELDAEVAWDEAALEAYAQLEPTDLTAVGIPDARAMAASLHLNLGDGYLRQGRVTEAGVQQRLGTRAAAALGGDDGYATTIRGGLERLSGRVEAARAR